MKVWLAHGTFCLHGPMEACLCFRGEHVEAVLECPSPKDNLIAEFPTSEQYKEGDFLRHKMQVTAVGTRRTSREVLRFEFAEVGELPRSKGKGKM